MYLSSMGGKGLSNLKDRALKQLHLKFQSFILVNFSFLYEILKVRYFLSINLPQLTLNSQTL